MKGKHEKQSLQNQNTQASQIADEPQRKRKRDAKHDDKVQIERRSREQRNRDRLRQDAQSNEETKERLKVHNNAGRTSKTEDNISKKEDTIRRPTVKQLNKYLRYYNRNTGKEITEDYRDQIISLDLTRSNGK